MPAMKKRPPMEMEPEMEEQRESEGVREGEDDMPMGKTNRKRSAKNAKRTKAPMDGEGCGCGGRKGKGKCDGNCGKKMDAAEPHWASGLAFDMDNLRVDLKCGNGAISQGEKCTKGPATRAQRRPSRVQASLESGAMAAGKVASVAGGVMAARSAMRGNYKGLARSLSVIGAGTAARGAGQYARGLRTGNSYLRNAGANNITAGTITAGLNSYFAGDLNSRTVSNLTTRARRTAQNAFGTASAKKSAFTQKKQRQEVWRGYKRSLLDSETAWAEGFSFDLAQLRTDLKCGNGAISEGEKCTKGPASRVTPRTEAKRAAKAQRKQEQSIVRGYQKMSFKQLNQQNDYLTREINARIKNEYKKPVGTEEELNEFYSYVTKTPEFKEQGHLLTAMGNKQRNRALRRGAAVLLAGPVAGLATGAVLGRKR